MALLQGRMLRLHPDPFPLLLLGAIRASAVNL
jgi:hypothetical protein